MTADVASPSPQPRFSAGDEEFQKLFLSHPWERTRLGPMESWPPSLRSYVSMILEAHGGRIRMEGAPSGGAAFVVELPLS